MIHKLLNQYVSKMSKDDILKFASKNDINLDENELNIIYNHIKENWEAIIYENPKPIMEDVKKNVNPSTYEKIESLYSEFYKKYKNYL